MQQFAVRFGISLAVGVVVSAIAVVTTWLELGTHPNLRSSQWVTQADLGRMNYEITSFQEKRGKLAWFMAFLEIPTGH